MEEQLKYMRVTALQDFTMLGYPAFQKGEEYVIVEEKGKILLERGLVEITVVKVDKLDEKEETKKSKSSLGTAK